MQMFIDVVLGGRFSKILIYVALYMWRDSPSKPSYNFLSALPI